MSGLQPPLSPGGRVAPKTLSLGGTAAGGGSKSNGRRAYGYRGGSPKQQHQRHRRHRSASSASSAPSPSGGGHLGHLGHLIPPITHSQSFTGLPTLVGAGPVPAVSPGAASPERRGGPSPSPRASPGRHRRSFSLPRSGLTVEYLEPFCEDDDDEDMPDDELMSARSAARDRRQTAAAAAAGGGAAAAAGGGRGTAAVPAVVSPGGSDARDDGSDDGSDRGSRGAAAPASPQAQAGGRRGRSLTRRRGGGGGEGERRSYSGHPAPRVASRSPAPASPGVRRLGDAVDALLDRRRRRRGGSVGPSPGEGAAYDGPGPYDPASLTDEERHVLAKIIVAVDDRLDHELDGVRDDLDGAEGRAEAARDDLAGMAARVALLEAELVQLRARPLEADGATRDAAREQMEEAEREHQTSIRAIQRVLADVTADGEAKVGALEGRVRDLEEQLQAARAGLAAASERAGGGPAGAGSDDLEKRDDKIRVLEQQVEAMASERYALNKQLSTTKSISAATISAKNAELRKAHVRIHGLKDEVKELGVDKDRTAYLEKELAAMRAEKDYLKVRLDKLVSERKEAAAMAPAPNSMSEEEGEKLRLENETLKESLSRVVSELKEGSDRRPPPSGNSEELDELQHANRALKKDLQEKASSLETAKLMITSLESASGCQANDLRAKLKERNQELGVLRVKVENYDSEMTTFKTEFLNLQQKYIESEKSGREAKALLKKQRSMHRQLRAEIAKIGGTQSTAEGSTEDDRGDIEVCIARDVSSAVKTSLDILEHSQTESNDPPDANIEVDNEVVVLAEKVEALTSEKENAVSKLQKELLTKNIELTNLDDQFKLQKEELDRLRRDSEKARQEYQQSLAESQFEIQRLTDDFAMNTERLVKRENELGVIQESLKVNQSESAVTGYFSDSDDEDDEDNASGMVAPDAAVRQAQITAEAENLQKFLGRGNAPGSPMSAATLERMKSMQSESANWERDRQELSKTIKEKDDALANAKMIISSIEQSNKTMMEDLRTRLHDSNTAIVSLLSKNQTAETMVEQLQRKREEEFCDAKRDREAFGQKLADLQEKYEALLRSRDDGSSLVSSLGTMSHYESSDGRDSSIDSEGKYPSFPRARSTSGELNGSEVEL